MTWNGLLLVLPPAARRTPITAIGVVSPPGDRVLLAVASGRAVQLWERVHGGRLRRRRGSMRHPGPVRALAHLGPGLLAAAGGEVVHLWDTDRRRRLAHLTTGGDGPVRALATLPAADGTAVLAAAQGDRVWLWDDPRRGYAAGPRPIERGRAVHALAVVRSAPDTTVLAVGDDVSLALWDPRTGTLIRDLPLGVPVRSLAVAGGALYVGSTAGIVAIDLATLLGPATGA
ncbi:hypothetical protein OHA72_51675 [Dactylosporangium sp. NBC_01737]|uniref:WD40 repeat domain-containing protein n=1 Tax=Dactylosporangium sp. NBC_01737 TaxID=2975959 RepID=UPI002E0F2DD0|nr:hypothetical protein OHA72_51675 [Dactylosporangium sp. NBC_01737]